jgi:putative inorganic carbon (hco3(-)) transporter
MSKREPWIYGLTAASAVAVLVSIAAAEILLAMACVAWVFFRPRRMVWPGYVIPLFVFMATTVLSLAMSPEPSIGTGVVRKFVLFAMGFLAANFVINDDRARLCYAALLGTAAVTSLAALGQFALRYTKFQATQSLTDDPMVLARITGFMGHWMTFSGEQLLIWCAAVPAVMVLGRRALLPLGIVGAALVLSFTRSAWLGALGGFLAVGLLLPRKIVIGVVVPVALVIAAASGLIYHRIAISFEPQNFSPDSGRLVMAITGFQMIQDHPVFGIGPERIHTEFPRYYHGNDLANFYYGHLHNNILQIAAERGLLCLAAFLWFIFQVYADLGRMLKTAPAKSRWHILSAIAAVTGFLIAGLFEYNFGDSEVLLLLLFIISLPYGAYETSRAEATHARERSFVNQV